jgi:hypothetical protein
VGPVPDPDLVVHHRLNPGDCHILGGDAQARGGRRPGARVERAVLDRAVRVGRTPRVGGLDGPWQPRTLSARAPRSPAAPSTPPGGRWPKGEEA